MLLKNKYIKIGIIILIVIALGGMALGAYVGGRVWTNKLPLEHDYDSIFDKGDYALDADENGLFKVLKISCVGRTVISISSVDEIIYFTSFTIYSAV